MRNLKILGLALLAITAVSVIGATAASADEFTATRYPATLTGKTHPEFTDEFTTTAGVVKAKKATYHGTLKEKDTQITMTAEYSEVTGFGFPAKVEMNGCSYRFFVKGGASTEGTVDIVCPAGVEITVIASSGPTVKCTVHIPAQNGLAKVIYANIGAAGETEEITVTAELAGIKYTHTAGTGVGACTSGSATNGSLKAKAVVTGEEDPKSGKPDEHIGLIMSTV